MSRALIPGFDWELVFKLYPAGTYFPVGCALRAEVRESPGATVLTALTTASGTLTRVSDSSVRVKIPALTSKPWLQREVSFDLIRTDVTPDSHYGFRVDIPVVQPITVQTES